MPADASPPPDLSPEGAVRRLYRDNAARGPQSLRQRLEDRLQAGQVRQVVRAATFAPGQRVLDVGAGRGAIARAARAAGAHVTAVDSVPELVARLTPEVDVALVGDAATLAVPGSFDRVLFVGVLEFVAEPAAVLARLAEKVAPGGQLVLLVPTPTWLGHLYRWEKRLHGVAVRLFEPAWCETEAARAGLHLRAATRPLPNNVLLVLERPPHGGGAPVRGEAEAGAA